MFPGVCGFHWSAGHLIFLGVFFTVAAIVFTTFVISSLRARRDLKTRKAETIRWHADFEDLPAVARICRHELTGELAHRICDNGFDCRKCDQHARFEGREAVEPCAILTNGDDEEKTILGFDMPPDRHYHRGHTWVKLEQDGTFTVGLDDFGSRLIGKPDRVDLPAVGAQVQVNGIAWNLSKKGSDVRILSPLEGEIIATGGHEQGWYLKIKPTGKSINLRHLLSGEEVRPWVMREMERLQYSLTSEGVGASLADGGVMVQDLSEAFAQVDWDAVMGEMFLEG